MKNTATLLTVIAVLGIPTWLNAGAKKNENEIKDLVRSPLNINQEMHISDDRGVLHENMIMSLKVMDNVRFYLTDGTALTGFVKEMIGEVSVVDGTQIYKVYGEINNKPNAGFGFVLTSTDIFAGAVVFRNTGETYTVVYSADIKGYILNRKLSDKEFKPSGLKKSKKELTVVESI
jgi:hypothetical protein